MIRVTLLTKAGDIVESVTTPPMQPLPEVIVWGQRVFVHEKGFLYREGLVWVVPETEGK